MKKTLLCFLLLFTTVFYSQGDIVVCESQTFNLNQQKAILLGNLNPDETTVTFYLNEDDALNNTNAISNPASYEGHSGSQTIYARIDNNGTITTNTFSLYKIPALNVLVIPNKPILCKGETGSLTINVSGGSGSYQYSLNESLFAGSNYYNNLPAGTYTIKILDVTTGCITIFAHTLRESTVLEATSVVLNENTIIMTTVGGTAPYQYSLDGINYQTSNVFPNSSPGFYVVRVRDSLGCAVTAAATVLPLLTAAVAVVKELDCIGNGTATIMATGAGGQPPYTYSINGGSYQTSNIFDILNAGVYSVTVKDAVNTTSISNSIVINPRVAVNGVALVTSPTSCTNASIMVQATSGHGPYLYSIDNGQTFTNNNTFNNLPAGNYFFLIKDSKGCISPPLFNTVQPPLPALTATASFTPLVCSNDKTSLTITTVGGQAPYAYSLNNSNYTSNNTFTNIDPGTYTITVRDMNGCLVTLPYNIAQPTPINGDFIIADQTLTITGQGGTAPYQYSIDQAPFQANNIFTNLFYGTHTIRLKDANGCESSNFSVVITVPITLSATADILPISCTTPTGTITINANGGIPPYQYSIDNGIHYTTTKTFTGLSAGNYTVLVRDAQNTTTPLPVTINQPAQLVVLSTVVNTFCNGDNSGSIQLLISGGKAPYYYSRNGAPYIALGSSQLATLSNLSSGMYVISVKDANGCIFTTSAMISQPNPLIASYTIENQTLTVNATGGNGVYTYSLDLNNYQTSNIFTNVSFGTHQIYVRDQYGCVTLMYVTIDPPAPLINGKNTLNIDFKPGQTLGDLIVEGQNIKWYSSPNSLSGKTNKSAETPLPLTTILVDGVTYYASQTINGIESTERLAVTAKVNGSLSNEDFVLPNFKYYPNPVQHALNISNSSNIDEVEIISVSGQSILAKKINNTQSEIDLSNLASGFYILKVKSEGQTKAIKIVKK